MNVSERMPGDIDELQRRIRQEPDAKQRDRYRSALLAIQGHDAPQIVKLTARSRSFVQTWAYAYRDHGIDGIQPRKPGVSNPKLSHEQQTRFIERFKSGPTEADEGRCTLRGKDGQRILEQEFGVQYSLNGVYKILHRHGLSCLSPRPRHRKQDLAAQQQWLGRAPLLSSR